MVSVDLPGLLLGVDVLLGDDSVHQHLGRAVDGDGDDHARARIEEAGDQHLVHAAIACPA